MQMKNELLHCQVSENLCDVSHLCRFLTGSSSMRMELKDSPVIFFFFNIVFVLADVILERDNK